MPNYRITIHMKIGEPKTGIRYFPSHDLERVRFLVGQKVRETLGRFTVDRIEVEMVEEDRRNLIEE